MFSQLPPFKSSWVFTMVHIAAVITTVTNGQTNITLGGLFSLGGPGADWDGSAIYQASRLAVRHVNEHPTVLSGYNLRIDVKNSKCRPGEGMKGFVNLINEEPAKIMILGASCSVVSQPVAETSQHWNLVQMSFSSASDVLSNKERFPYFFRTNPAQSGLNQPRIAIMKEYGWDRVAVIHDSSEYFTSAINSFSEDLSVNNLTLVAKESFLAGQTPTVQLQSIKTKDARIIVASAYEDGLQQVFCEAYRLGMYGQKYVWMIESWNSLDWWKNVTWLGCSADQMYQVADKYIGTVFLNLRTDDKRTVSGLTARQYEEAYMSFTRGEPYAGLDFAHFGYDAVWAVALAVHAVTQQLTAENSSINIQDFDYDNTYHLRERIMQALADLVFEGVTGPVSFDKSGNRLAMFKMEQLIDGVEQTVGIYSSDFGLQWTSMDRLAFTGGATPRDGPGLESEYLGISMDIFAVFSAIAVVGMSLTVTFLAINVIYRHRRIIKLSCPNVNNAIAVGCFMCYLNVIVAGLNQSFAPEIVVDNCCLAQAWILPIAFSLAFGGLFAKTWRVHVIFSNKTKKTKIRDYHLFIIIGIVVLVDVIISLVWTVCDPSRLVRIVLDDKLDKENDRIIQRSFDKCDSPNSPQYVWIGIIFAWKGILLLYGAFLAWETRKVTMPQLNDSKYIAMAIYNVAVPSIIIAPLVLFISNDRPGVTFMLTSSCVLFGTTVTNSLIFIPKIIGLWSYERNGDAQEHGTFCTTNQIAPQRLGTVSVEVSPAIKEKNREISELRDKLKQKDEIIQSLNETLEKMRNNQLKEISVVDSQIEA